MSTPSIPAGVVHALPSDVRKALQNDTEALVCWQEITPLARNEWICWIEEAKKEVTRIRRITRLRNDLKSGKRRPCCWLGCPHRKHSQTETACT